MMAFVVCRSDVGFVGYLNGESIIIYSTTEKNDSTKKISLKGDLKEFNAKSESNVESKSGESFSSNLISACVSDCGKFIAASGHNKALYLWKKTDDFNFGPLKCCFLTRKCHKLTFTHSGSELIVVDRSGDVFSFSVTSSETKGKLILGHISMVLDIAVSKNDQCIITCDRDGKIRVSLYPNTYNIYSYCLDHDEFVSSLQLIDLGMEFLLSGSGDGTLRLWNYEEGSQISHYDFTESLPCDQSTETCSEEKDTNTYSKMPSQTHAFAIRTLRYSVCNNMVAVLFYTNKDIAVFNVSCENIELTQLIPLESTAVDAYFDSSGNLWLLTVSKTKPLVLLTCDEDKILTMPSDDDPIEEHIDSAIVSEINEKGITFGNINFESELVMLYKHCNEYDDGLEKRGDEPCPKRNKTQDL